MNLTPMDNGLYVTFAPSFASANEWNFKRPDIIVEPEHEKKPEQIIIAFKLVGIGKVICIV